jgi:60 kDa SS-A/Ro ribonucleoprotein
MAKLNIFKRFKKARTHEGSPARTFGPEQQLRRSIMNFMLWEDEFYEDGEAIADRVQALVPKVAPETVAQIAIDAREKSKLRHAPLLLVRAMAASEKHRALVASTLERVIQRPDEMTEFLAIYWSDVLGLQQQRKKRPVPAQVKKGLAKAFAKFDAYQLAKYDRDGPVRLRDVLFITHAKPVNADQAKIWKQLVDGTLASPDKKETFERLIAEKKLGALALLRNLRGMLHAGVTKKTIGRALEEMRTDRVLPYRFIAAARYAPDVEPELEKAMFRALEGHKKLEGKTRLLIDVSGSMSAPMSARSEMLRLDAATGLAALVREIADDVEIFTFSNDLKKVPPRRGLALRDAIVQSQPHSSTYLGRAVTEVDEKGTRLIVITDEQSHDTVPAPKGKGYMINVASARNGVGAGNWTRVDGFSEAVIDWIIAQEGEE